MAQFTILGYTFDHLASTTLMGNGRAYRVNTEEGYYIHKPEFDELEYKTTTFLYATDDLSAVEIVAFDDLPEGAVINGGNDDSIENYIEVEIGGEEE